MEVAEASTPFLLGAVLEVTDGWHLYWEHPGDAGQETWADLSLPEGWAAGPARYPGPERFTTQGVQSFGWDGGGAVIHEVTATQGGTVTAQVGWLACKTICVAGEAEVALQLEVGALRPSTALDGWKARLPVGTLPAASTDTLTWRIEVQGAELFPGPELDLALASHQQDETHYSLVLKRPAPGAWGVIAVHDPATTSVSYHRVTLEP